ncbi:MAG TPA: hypothetical protein ENI97_10130 [Gammaproteobacteria bacterium]|nr:hypothetical protein [Gammaproteobacteria bacterium]
MNKLKPTSGCFLTGGQMAAYPQSLMCREVVNKLASVVDRMEQSVHKTIRERIDVCVISFCLRRRICNMASLACIVQYPHSNRYF